MVNRPTYLHINLDAFLTNYQSIQRVSKKEIFAVVKANAYGHGMIGIAKFLDSLQCAYICVSSLDEAVRLRNHGIISPILILGYVELSQEVVDFVSNNDITLSVISFEWFSSLIDFSLSSKLKVHIEIDNGMNRLGFKDVQEVAKVIALSNHYNLDVEGIYTHFHSSDKADDSLQNQFTQFKHFLSVLPHHFKWIHTANSDAIFNLDDTISNAVRPGLALYGYSSTSIKLTPVMTLHSKITQKKLVHKGETISYGATFKATEDMWIGIVPAGYADGIPIGLSNHYHVYVDSLACEVIGKICMDQLMIKLPHKVTSNHVILSGIDNNFALMAKLTNTITYEVLTCLNARIHRLFSLNNTLYYEE